MRSWTLEFPFTEAPVSSNERIHWSRRYAESTKWKDATYWLCREAGIPELARVSLVVHVLPPDRRRRDSDNLVAYLLKPIKDGLVMAKVVPDDTDRYMTWRLVLEEGPNRDRSWVYWAEVEELA